MKVTLILGQKRLEKLTTVTTCVLHVPPSIKGSWAHCSKTLRRQVNRVVEQIAQTVILNSLFCSQICSVSGAQWGQPVSATQASPGPARSLGSPGSSLLHRSAVIAGSWLRS